CGLARLIEADSLGRQPPIRNHEPVVTSIVSTDSAFKEHVIKQVFSAFSSKRFARSASPPDGNARRARKWIWVKRVTPSTRSSTPSASQWTRSHGSFDARAIARKVRIKQSAEAATSSVSGDHWSPDPPNCAGGDDDRLGSRSDVNA